jgi:bifunctional DNA-binding transcriptional regulator/antitoxin component of YhaV-PrlF toxin-antitoxin module
LSLNDLPIAQDVWRKVCDLAGRARRACNDLLHALAVASTMKAVVSDTGGVTIPQALRRQLRIRPGDVLDFQEHCGQLVATKHGTPDPVDALYGILKLGQPTNRLMRALRGTADAV